MTFRILSVATIVAALGSMAALGTPRVMPNAGARSAMSPVTYVATMKSSSEVPANASKGTGTATFSLDDTHLSFKITVAGLSGPATGAHIHVGAAGAAGGVVHGFTVNAVADGTVAEGTIDLKMHVSPTVSGDSLKVLLNNGNAYVNVHTAANPGGEIRGQLLVKK